MSDILQKRKGKFSMDTMLAPYAIPGLPRRMFIRPSNKDAIVRSVLINTCLEYDVEESEIRSRIQKRRILEPRQVAMYILWKTQIMMNVEIGRIFGKDHTNVYHSTQHIEDLIAAHPCIADRVERIRQNSGL